MAFYKESLAEAAFRQAGPIHHLYTKGLECEVLFHSDEDRIVAVNYVAIAIKVSGCKLLAYAVMDNHFHFIVEGMAAQALAFYDNFRGMFGKYLSRHGRSGTIMGLAEPGLKTITSLRQLRNEIAYVLRNPFVVNPDVNVFAYPWTSGNLYFNPQIKLEGIPASMLAVRHLRAFTKLKDTSAIDESIHFLDGIAQPWSFVDYKYAESFFDNARQFVFCVLRNVEGQIEAALNCGEIPVLCDDELIPHVYKLCSEKFRADSPSTLDNSAKKQLALMLKKTFYSSNKQIARLAKLPLADVNTLFPLSVPK